LLGGHTDFYVGITVPALNYAAEGKIKAYAVTSERRLRGYPNIPTLKELGVNRVDYGWASVSLPAAAKDHAEMVGTNGKNYLGQKRTSYQIRPSCWYCWRRDRPSVRLLAILFMK